MEPVTRYIGKFEYEYGNLSAAADMIRNAAQCAVFVDTVRCDPEKPFNIETRENVWTTLVCRRKKRQAPFQILTPMHQKAILYGDTNLSTRAIRNVVQRLVLDFHASAGTIKNHGTPGELAHTVVNPDGTRPYGELTEKAIPYLTYDELTENAVTYLARITDEYGYRLTTDFPSRTCVITAGQLFGAENDQIAEAAGENAVFRPHDTTDPEELLKQAKELAVLYAYMFVEKRLLGENEVLNEDNQENIEFHKDRFRLLSDAWRTLHAYMPV